MGLVSAAAAWTVSSRACCKGIALPRKARQRRNWASKFVPGEDVSGDDDGRRRRFRIGCVLGVVVPFQLALDAAKRIGTRPRQVFFGVIEFILVKLQLSLGQIELLLHAVLMSAGGGGKLLLQLVDADPGRL